MKCIVLRKAGRYPQHFSYIAHRNTQRFMLTPRSWGDRKQNAAVKKAEVYDGQNTWRSSLDTDGRRSAADPGCS